MQTSQTFGSAVRKRLSVSKLRRRAELAPATQQLQETFALRRILLKHGQRTDVREECQFVRKFLAERTTLWRDLFWPLLTSKEQLKVAGCVKLRMVPSDGEGHDFVAADSASGCLTVASLKGLAQVQCFDSAGSKIEFHPLETFGFLPVPGFLKADALDSVEKVKANPRSKVFRGERDYGERRQIVNDARKIRVKVPPGGQYLAISGADVGPLLKKVAEKKGRAHLMKSIGLEFPGMGTGAGGAAAGEAGARKREVLMKEARYGIGSILVHEGSPPTTVFVIVEGECRIVKGRPASYPAARLSFGAYRDISSDNRARMVLAAAKLMSRSARYNLGSRQNNKVDLLLTSGFHTQVDVCHLGSLGPKATVGDIPALLGGVQPASVVAKTPLKVLQCRADKFAAHLDHNIRAKLACVEAAKARKARITERGSDVERLMCLKGEGTPLLVDISSKDLCVASAQHVVRRDTGDFKVVCEGQDVVDGRRLIRKGGIVETVATPDLVDSRKTLQTASKANNRSGGSPEDCAGQGNGRDATGCPCTAQPAVADEIQRDGEQRSGSKLSVNAPDSQTGGGGQRAAAITSSSSLPCFSLGSRAHLPGQSRASTAGKADGPVQLDTCLTLERRVSWGNLAVPRHPSYAHGFRGKWTDESLCDSLPASTMAGARACSASAAGDNRGCFRGEELATALLASHLTPFPSITKNRSLHAVSQPTVRHSEGFADACGSENSKLGNTAWRVARSARFQDLVAPADRLSIVRQIEAGFDALTSRRVSPVA